VGCSGQGHGSEGSWGGNGVQLLLAIAGDALRAEPLVPSREVAGARDLGPGGSQSREHQLRFEEGS
jgi:hypothetical protein